MSAYARVELRGSSSHRAMGRPEFTKRGQVRYLSNADDIAYFKAQSAFKVVDLEPPSKDAKPVAAVKPAPARRQPPPPMFQPPAPAETDEPPPEVEELPPWKPNMSKQDLIEAAAARNIAVTPDDKKADIIELLRMHDEDASEDDASEDDASEDEDEDGDNEDED
jgi:hypothetical protein